MRCTTWGDKQGVHGSTDLAYKDFVDKGRSTNLCVECSVKLKIDIIVAIMCNGYSAEERAVMHQKMDNMNFCTLFSNFHLLKYAPVFTKAVILLILNQPILNNPAYILYTFAKCCYHHYV